MKDWAIIFDVDGVLLELTHAEEELFFQPFAKRMDADLLSRDWNSYSIRNDEDIVREIVERYDLPRTEVDAITSEYLALLEYHLNIRHSGENRNLSDKDPGFRRSDNVGVMAQPIAGAGEMLASFASHTKLGIATANFREAARLRLLQAQMWAPVCELAYGADGGGHKTEILGRAIAASGIPTSRIIFIGDNVSDVKAGLSNNVHFIGFSSDALRRKALAAAGGTRLCADHTQTRLTIQQILNA